MIAVVGGANIDIIGTAEVLRLRDSCPGRVALVPGGVGRNMAERFRALGHEVQLLTALGADAHAELIRANCAHLGIDLTHALICPDARTSTYLCINGPDGDLAVAVSDMAICEQLTRGYVLSRQAALGAGALVAVDANLPTEAIRALAETARVPIAADPVSVAKAERLRPILDRLWLIKPNVPEAEALTGLSEERVGVSGLAEALAKAGAQNVFISMGARGAYYLSGAERGHLPCYPGPITSTNGCGDAFMAAAASARLVGASAAKSAKHALAAAALVAAGRPLSQSAAQQVIKNGGI